MARVTIENIKIDNRYEMILLAAHRARNLEFGAKPVIDVKNKKVKHALLALMEIESGEIDIVELRKVVANQGDSSLKITEVVVEDEKQQAQDNIKASQEKQLDTTIKEPVYEQMIYEDEKKIEN